MILVSLVVQWQRICQPVRETWVRSLGPEDPPRREWQPTPVFFPGKSHGQRHLAGYSPWTWAWIKSNCPVPRTERKKHDLKKRTEPCWTLSQYQVIKCMYNWCSGRRGEMDEVIHLKVLVCWHENKEIDSVLTYYIQGALFKCLWYWAKGRKRVFHFHTSEERKRIGLFNSKESKAREETLGQTLQAWRIPGAGEPDGLPSVGSHRVGHDWSDVAAAAASVN